VDSGQFADARACSFGAGSDPDSTLLVVYANHEMILWDIQNLAQVRIQLIAIRHAYNQARFALQQPANRRS
jgi:hypothetical protein